MKILTLHCDFIKFKPLKKALKKPEKITKKQEKGEEIKEPLVIFTAVEKQDEKSKDIVDKLIKEILDISTKVKSKNLVLYPYAHLSSKLASPSYARMILIKTEEQLKKQGFQVSRAPFGYYKEFELKCKGHPLAELSREIISEKAGDEKTKQFEEQIDPKKLLKQVSKTNLDTSKLKENDHRIIGKQMDLFSFNETAPGMVFWHNNGGKFQGTGKNIKKIYF